MTGCAGSPWILVARPFSMLISTPQASGQSCGHTAWTTFFIAENQLCDYPMGRPKKRWTAPRNPAPAKLFVAFGTNRLNPGARRTLAG